MNNKVAAGALCAAIVIGAGVYFGGVVFTKHQADKMLPAALENANKQLDAKGTGLRIDYERLSDGLMSEKAKITMIWDPVRSTVANLSPADIASIGRQSLVLEGDIDYGFLSYDSRFRTVSSSFDPKLREYGLKSFPDIRININGGVSGNLHANVQVPETELKSENGGGSFKLREAKITYSADARTGKLLDGSLDAGGAVVSSKDDSGEISLNVGRVKTDVEESGRMDSFVESASFDFTPKSDTAHSLNASAQEIRVKSGMDGSDYGYALSAGNLVYTIAGKLAEKPVKGVFTVNDAQLNFRVRNAQKGLEEALSGSDEQALLRYIRANGLDMSADLGGKYGKGDISLKADAKVQKGFDPTNYAQYAGKVEAKASVSLPKALIADIDNTSEAFGNTANLSDMMLMVKDFLKITDTTISTDAELKDGHLKVNGKNVM